MYIYGWMNGTNSDNAGFNPEDGYSDYGYSEDGWSEHGFSEHGYSEHGWLEPGYSERSLSEPGSLNMVTPKLLGTRLHRHGCVQRW